MALSRNQKQSVVKKYSESLQDCRMAFLVEYSGITIPQTDKIRVKLDENKSSMMIVKNRLLKHAIKGTHFEKFGEHLQGPLALVTSKEDMVSPTKAIYPFITDKELPIKLRVAINFESPDPISEAQFTTIAKLPSREELLAKVLGSMMAPIQNVVGVLTAVPRNLVYALSQVSQQKKE
jgi:large subunit ribosomal protein L10